MGQMASEEQLLALRALVKNQKDYDLLVKPTRRKTDKDTIEEKLILLREIMVEADNEGQYDRKIAASTLYSSIKYNLYQALKLSSISYHKKRVGDFVSEEKILEDTQTVYYSLTGKEAA